MLHVDLDEFVAAVEVLRRPELAGAPVIVGGRGDPTERGVVATASYAARAFGVRSGMALRLAARKAPDAVFLPLDVPSYTAASEQVMTILRASGAVVQILGWDEAFLGVRTDDPWTFARGIQAEVLAGTGLHCSVGIGDNIVRAKIATGFGKPRGVFALTADNWMPVMGERPTRELWGVGSKVAARLAEHGLRTVADLAAADPDVLVAEFGPRRGPWYGRLGRGEGSTVVSGAPHVARGRGRERTYQTNLTSADEIAADLDSLTDQVMADLREEGRPAVRVTLKVRYAPFRTKTYGRRLPVATADAGVIAATVRGLQARIEPEREIRLLGVHLDLAAPLSAESE